MAWLHAIWSWLREWGPYTIPALASAVLVVLGVWLSLPDFAQKVQDNPTYRKLLAAVCIALGFVGFIADVKARHDADISNKQLMHNTNTLVQDTSALVHSTTDMLNRIGVTSQQESAHSAALMMRLQKAQNDIDQQAYALNHMDLRIMSAKDLIGKAKQITKDADAVVYTYNWRINQGVWMAYFDRMDGGQSTEAELAELKKQALQMQEEYRKQYREEAKRLLVQVGPVCEEMVRRLGESNSTEYKGWAKEFTYPSSDAAEELGGLINYMQGLCVRLQNMT